MARRMLMFVPINRGEVHNYTGAHSLSSLPRAVPLSLPRSIPLFPSLPSQIQLSRMPYTLTDIVNTNFEYVWENPLDEIEASLLGDGQYQMTVSLLQFVFILYLK